MSQTSVELHTWAAEADNPHIVENSEEPTDTSAIFEASRRADAEVPDGGHGWVVVLCCAVVAFWFVGTTYSWGVLQDGLVSQGLASASTLAFIGSLAVTEIAAFAIINARLVQKFGPRKLALLGISLMGTSQILSGFTTKSLGGLFATAGVMMGYGVSCCFSAISVTPAQWFNKRRGLANGIVFAGGGLGGAVISLAMSAIVGKLGVEWAFRVIGLLMLSTGLPAAWFVQQRVPIPATSLIEWRLFKDVKFLALFATGAIGTFPLLVPPFFLPLYAGSLGLPSHIGAALVATFNFSSAIGRILCGAMGDKLGPVNCLFVSLLVSAISMLALWPISTSLAPLIIFTIINGMSNGAFFAIIPTVVGSVFGSARLSVAMSMIVTGWVGGYLMGAPIAGYVLDASGGSTGGFEAYRPAIFYAGSMAVGATAMAGLVRFRMSKDPRKIL